MFDRLEQMSNKNAILSNFRCFLSCLRPGSFSVKGANNRIACIRSACAGSTYVKGDYIEDTCIGDVCVRRACIGTIGAVKCSKIYLQLS